MYFKQTGKIILMLLVQTRKSDAQVVLLTTGCRWVHVLKHSEITKKNLQRFQLSLHQVCDQQGGTEGIQLLQSCRDTIINNNQVHLGQLGIFQQPSPGLAFLMISLFFPQNLTYFDINPVPSAHLTSESSPQRTLHWQQVLCTE